MKYLHLRAGKRAMVDDEDYLRLAPFTWYLSPNGVIIRADYNPPLGKDKSITIAREVLGITDARMVTYRNGNNLDNRRSNLLLGTCSQVRAHKRLSARNTSGYRGVTWDKVHKTWQGQITVNGRTHALGRSSDPRKLALKYNQAALSAFGEFAQVNEVTE